MKKVLLLFGGESKEHQVSCESANFIIQNIDKKKYNLSIVGITTNGTWYKINNNFKIDKDWQNTLNEKIDNIVEYLKSFDIVFNIIHGNTGEDGKLQSLFELFKIKYVGCDSYSSLICYDKLITKLFLEKYNIPQVPYLIYNDKIDLKQIEYPIIVKPNKSGSSIGINIANNYKEAKRAIGKALKVDSSVIIEKYIKNKRELECAIIENKNKLIISEIGEIINNAKWYDYISKYKSNTEIKIANISEDLANQIKNLSKTIFKILKCKKLSRIDFILDLDDNTLYFNEINTIPGFTKFSMFPMLIEKLGINQSKLLDIMLDG